MIPLEKWKVLTPKNFLKCGQWAKIIVDTGLKSYPKWNKSPNLDTLHMGLISFNPAAELFNYFATRWKFKKNKISSAISFFKLTLNSPYFKDFSIVGDDDWLVRRLLLLRCHVRLDSRLQLDLCSGYERKDIGRTWIALRQKMIFKICLTDVFVCINYL